MAINIDTRQYMRAHGKEPRGRGTWAFIYEDEPARQLWSPANLTYREACAWVRREFRAAGLDATLHVGS